MTESLPMMWVDADTETFICAFTSSYLKKVSKIESMTI